MTPTPTVTDVARRSRYEIDVDGRLAGSAVYKLKPGRVVFIHTEIDQSFEGQGLGSVLAQGALDDVRARGLAVVPLCPFFKGWIARHPDYADLVYQAP
nr:GNAT family N-acetyltransferase [Micromonospora sp. DSM 115978]